MIIDILKVLKIFIYNMWVILCCNNLVFFRIIRIISNFYYFRMVYVLMVNYIFFDVYVKSRFNGESILMFLFLFSLEIMYGMFWLIILKLMC